MVFEAYLASPVVSAGAALQVADELSAGDNLAIELAGHGTLSAQVMSALSDHLHLALDSRHLFLRPWVPGHAPLPAQQGADGAMAWWVITAVSP